MADCPWICVRFDGRNSYLDEHHAAYDFAMNQQPLEYPSFVALIGRRAKAKLLANVLGGADQSTPGLHNQLYLKRDTQKTNLLFVDSELHCSPATASVAGTGYGRKTTRAVHEEADPTPQSVSGLVYGRVLGSLADCICYFAADFGGLRRLAEFMAVHLVQPPSSDMRRILLPEAIIIVSTRSDNFNSALIEMRFRRHLDSSMEHLKAYGDGETPDDDIAAHYRSIRILALHAERTTASRVVAFRKSVGAVANEAARLRRVHRLLFHTRHWKALVGHILDHACASIKPLDLISSTRPWAFSMQEFEVHLSALLESLPSVAWLWHFACPLVSSAILLASYPPNSHYFSPKLLFERSYHDACRSAICKYSVHKDVQTKFVRALQNDLAGLFDQMVASNGAVSAKRLHVRRLQVLGSQFRALKSNTSCFCCLMAAPEKVFDCGHAVCNTCLQILSERSPVHKNSYYVPHCFLCGANTLETANTFSLVPPTAGIRILSIDGGGVRGVIPLVYLEYLSRHLQQLGCPLRDFFDFICGTSAGGLISIGLGIMKWTPEDCLRRFEDLAVDTFGAPSQRSSFGAMFKDLVRSYLRDHRYETARIKDAFDQDLAYAPGLFNPLTEDRKVSVTTTAVGDSVPCLMTNYNGGILQREQGHQMIRASLPDHAISIGDAATCTSAAPWFFKPTYLKHLGTFQDGGLLHNNPLGLALSECQSLWPQKPRPDLALSLGTGADKKRLLVKNTHQPMTERFIPRICKAFLKQTDGETAWQELSLLLPLELKTRLHRFNVHLEKPEPKLDNVAAIGFLKQLASSALATGDVMIPVVDALYASMFYLELESEPVFVDDGYHCRGHIFCRQSLPLSGVKWLYSTLQDTSSYFLVNGRPFTCVPFPSMVRRCPKYAVAVEFRVPELSALLDITLLGITKYPQHISGLPRSVSDLIQLQGLSAPFGRVDHCTGNEPGPHRIAKRKISRGKS